MTIQQVNYFRLMVFLQNKTEIVFKSLAVLLTVHNRQAKTLACLEQVFDQVDLGNIVLDVYLTNDGSTDGTKEAIKERFPKVEIIQGDGSLYWNRGMYKAWEKATNTKAYDFYLWLNDDTLLFPDALSNVIATYNLLEKPALVCGVTRSSDLLKLTYGGRNEKGDLIEPNGEFQECRTTNGNFVLVPKQVYEKVGNLDWRFRHSIGDLDYSLRVQAAGFKCYVSPFCVGICDSRNIVPNCFKIDVPLFKRLKELYKPLSYSNPIEFFVFENRHYGLFPAVFHFVTIHLRTFFPYLWVIFKR